MSTPPLYSKTENWIISILMIVSGLFMVYILLPNRPREYQLGDTARIKYTYENREYDYILHFTQDTINWTLADLTREISRPMVSSTRQTHHTKIEMRADEQKYHVDVLGFVRSLRALSYVRLHVAKGEHQQSTFSTWVT